MKTRKFAAAATAALIGLTSVGVAQAAPRDWGHRGNPGYDHRWDRGSWRGHRGGSDGLGLALGLGILGAALIASQANTQPYAYSPSYPAPAYDPNYGYYQAPQYAYPPQYSAPYRAPSGY